MSNFLSKIKNIKSSGNAVDSGVNKMTSISLKIKKPKQNFDELNKIKQKYLWEQQKKALGVEENAQKVTPKNDVKNDEVLIDQIILENQGVNVGSAVSLDKNETGFEFLDNDEYKSTRLDLGKSVKIDINESYKEKLITEQDKEENEVSNKRFGNTFSLKKFVQQVVKNHFRTNAFLFETAKGKMFHWGNVFGFVTFIALLHYFTTYYLSLNQKWKMTLTFGLPILVAYFFYCMIDFWKVYKEKKNQYDVNWFSALKTVFLAPINWLTLIGSGFLLSYFLTRFWGGGAALLLFLTFMIVLYYITQKHLISLLVGALILLNVMLTPAMVIDWDKKSLVVEQRNVVTAHLLDNMVANVEIVPNAITFPVSGNYELGGIPLIYTFNVLLKPTDTLLASLKLSKCQSERIDNCEIYNDYFSAYQRGETNSSIGPLSFTVDDKIYFIRNFKEYQLFAQSVLNTEIFKLMKHNLKRIRLPLRESDYKFTLPEKIKNDLNAGILGYPEIVLGLSRLSNLEQRKIQR